jgi:sodium transport system permease protein
VVIEDEVRAQTQFFSMFFPFIVLTFLFSGCIAIAPESIAGEKERGTMATILITPIKRTELALGKITSLSIVSMVSAISSFIGIMLSLPRLMGGLGSASIYGFGEWAMVFLLLVSTVLIIIGIMSLISSFAKSIKEAAMLLSPFMIVSMLVGLTSMMNDGAATNRLAYLIPIYNSVQSLVSILSFEPDIGNLLITFGANMAYVGLCVFVLAKLFNNEKVMFSK